MQLSNLAALQQKIDVSRDDADINGSQSRKRMADGFVKHTRHHSSASPVRISHSRNTSTISVASTTGSRISEVRIILYLEGLFLVMARTTDASISSLPS